MRKKIGELLVEAGVVTEEQVRVALGRRGAFGSHRLGEVLVAQGLCTPTHIAQALSAQHALPFVALPEEIPANVAGWCPWTSSPSTASCRSGWKWKAAASASSSRWMTRRT